MSNLLHGSRRALLGAVPSTYVAEVVEAVESIEIVEVIDDIEVVEDIGYIGLFNRIIDKVRNIFNR